MTNRISTKETHEEQTKRLRDEIEKKTGKTAEQLYEEREKRIRDAIQLREPDRVPVGLAMGNFPGIYAGLDMSAVFYDQVAWREATRKAILDFEPDLYTGGDGAQAGAALEVLDPTNMRWPGYNLPTTVSRQVIEAELMKEDEYDLFLSDPSDFILRYYLPRSFRALEPLAALPSLTDRFTGFPAMTPIFTRAEFQELGRALLKAGEEQDKVRQAMSALGDFQEEMASLGFPPRSHSGGISGLPFDVISQNLRGMQGTMADMYRRPDKLLAACDKILEWQVKRAVHADPRKRGNPKRIHIHIHRGQDSLMSRKHFETFYWPYMKKVILTNLALGYVSLISFEGSYDSRVEYLLELTKGSAVVYCYQTQTDMVRAKEILAGHSCVMGFVPDILLTAGSSQEVEEYCRNLIKACGSGGGFILSTGSIDNVKPTNVRAMIEAVKKYSVY